MTPNPCARTNMELSPDILFSLFKQIYRTGIALLVKVLKFRYEYPLPLESTHHTQMYHRFLDFVGKLDLMFFNSILQPLYKLETLQDILQFKKELETSASKIEDSNMFDVTKLLRDDFYLRRAQRNELPKIYVGYFELINLHLTKSRDFFGTGFLGDLMAKLTKKIKQIERQIILDDNLQIHKMDLGRPRHSNRRFQNQRLGLFFESHSIFEFFLDYPLSPNPKLLLLLGRVRLHRFGSVLFLRVLRGQCPIQTCAPRGAFPGPEPNRRKQAPKVRQFEHQMLRKLRFPFD